MHRIDTENAQASIPTPKATGATPNGFFTHGDPTTPVIATRVVPDILNAIQEELCYTIIQSGQTLNKAIQTQLYAAIQALISEGITTLGIGSLHGDTTPSLGGDLSVNAKSIFATTGQPIELNPTSGDINLDASALKVGASPSFLGFVHTGNTSNKIILGTTTFGLYTNALKISAGGAGTGFRLYDGTYSDGIASISQDISFSANSNSLLSEQESIQAYVDAVGNGKKQEYYIHIWRNATTIGEVLDTQTFPLTFTLTGADYKIGELIFYVATAPVADGSHTGVYSLDIYGLDSADNSQLLLNQVTTTPSFSPGSMSSMVDFKIASSGLNCNRFYIHFDGSQSTVAPTVVMARMTFREV